MGGFVPLGMTSATVALSSTKGRRRPSDMFSGDTKSSAAFGCSKKIWTAAVSFPSGEPQRPESSLADTRFPEGHFTRSSRIRFT
jgi:hypothetical protein